ncbi:MAG: transposase [Dysgonamonadaceae bacterium]|nr:transposase [Dysgonamonadaceae bacterium]
MASSGDAHTANNFKAFLEETLLFLNDKKTELLRLDSGFYSNDIFEYLETENRKTDYITAVPMYTTIQCKIATQKAWLGVDKGIEIGEFEYRAPEWRKPRRMEVVRQKVTVRPQAPGKQLRLLEDDMEINGYRYACYVSTLKLSAADVWRLCRGRACCENRIKELKYDYGLDKMNQSDFDGTESALLLVTIAYNFLALFMQLIIGGNVRNQIKTLRHRMLDIPSITEKSEDRIIVKMPLHMNRRNWIA